MIIIVDNSLGLVGITELKKLEVENIAEESSMHTKDQRG